MGGRGRSPVLRDPRRGTAPVPLRGDSDGDRRTDNDGHAVAARVRQRRAQAPLPRVGHPGRGGLLHRGDRARRRLGRGRPSHPSRTRRRTLDHQRQQALHHQRHPSRLAVPARAHLYEDGYRGMSQIIVETSTPGFSESRKPAKLGNRSSDTAELFFDDVRVPVRNTIGEIGRGFQQQMAQFVIERIFAAYGAVGSCRVGVGAYSRLPAAAGGLRPAAAGQPVHRVPPGRAVCSGGAAAVAQLRLRTGVHGRRGHHPGGHGGQAHRGPVDARGGRHLPAVPRRPGARWRRPGRPGSSATPGWPPSAAARTRSCCRCWHGWTGSWHDSDH